MKSTILALALFFVCDPPDQPTGSTGDGSTSTTSGEPTGGATGGPGYVCDDVGLPCDPKAPSCAAGLDCVELPDDWSKGVCAQKCNTEGGPAAAPCKIGWCDIPFGAAYGMCRDPDGLPTGLCDGIPSCAGDPCEGACANGLSCIVGACAFACQMAADCEVGQACLAGACFDADGLADPCN